MAICESFSAKFGNVACFGGSTSEQPAKVFLQKSYFPPIRESFLLYGMKGEREGVTSESIPTADTSQKRNLYNLPC